MIEKYIMIMMRVVFFQNKKDVKRYNTKYQKTYSNWYYALKNDYIKYTRILWTYSGIQKRATGCVYLNGSQYSDAEVLSQLRSCLRYAIIDADPVIGVKLKNWIV